MSKKELTFSIIAVSFIFLSVCSAAAQNIITTTSWTAAFAVTAGAENIEVIAPAEMLNPSEYQLTSGDMIKLKNADLIIFAGYEVMMNTVMESLNIPDEAMLQIETRHDMPTVRASVAKIAEKLGTEKTAAENIAAIESYLKIESDLLRRGGGSARGYLVHSFQVPLAKTLGLNIVGTFGPAPLSAVQISEAAKLKPAVIIDNLPDPVSSPLTEFLPDSDIVIWRNFPGRVAAEGNLLYDIIAFNVNELKWNTSR